MDRPEVAEKTLCGHESRTHPRTPESVRLQFCEEPIHNLIEIVTDPGPLLPTDGCMQPPSPGVTGRK